MTESSEKLENLNDLFEKSAKVHQWIENICEQFIFTIGDVPNHVELYQLLDIYETFDKGLQEYLFCKMLNDVVALGLNLKQYQSQTGEEKSVFDGFSFSGGYL